MIINGDVMSYTGKIIINYKPQGVEYTRDVKMPEGPYTLDDISKHLKEGEKFDFFEEEDPDLHLPVKYLRVYGYRLETKEETAQRITELEEHNKIIEQTPEYVRIMRKRKVQEEQERVIAR